MKAEKVFNAIGRYSGTALVVAIVGSLLALSTAQRSQPTYSADVTMRIGNAPDSLDADAAWVDLLRSYRVTDHVVKQQLLVLQYDERDADVLRTLRVDTAYFPNEYRLRVDREGRYVILSTREFTADSVNVGEPIGSRLGFIWNPQAGSLKAGREVRFKVLNPRVASEALNDHVGVELLADVMHISYRDTNPVRAAEVANSLASRFVETSVKLRELAAVGKQSAEASLLPDIRIMSGAHIPDSPSGNNPAVIAVGGIALSVILAVAAAMWRDSMTV